MLGINWKTNLSSIITGILTLLLGIPTFITAITAWGNHQPVDWRSVLVTTALAAITVGLQSAKDKEVHGGTVDTGTRPAPGVMAAAQAKVEEKKKP